jgi:hypothetical protein
LHILILLKSDTNIDRGVQTFGRIQCILNSAGPFQIVVPDSGSSHDLSIALRLVHDLNTYHRLDAEIFTGSDALQLLQRNALSTGNVVVVGGAQAPFTKSGLSQNKTCFTLQDGLITLRGRSLVDAGQGTLSSPCFLQIPKLTLLITRGIMFLHPHPTRSEGTMLFMFGSDASGLEQAARLFPIRTGVTVPDWLLVSKYSDRVGAGGTMGAGYVFLGLWE